jgi:uncharacterized BrkB/YihY/UPF0761 family membrane protein
MTKAILSILLAVLLACSVLACKIWIVVEFIIYLVKDDPFNWWSVWLWLISIVSLLVFYLFYLLPKKEPENTGAFKPGLPKSKFAQRLEEAQRLQQERRNG